MTTAPNTVTGTPLTRSAAAALPVLLDAHAHLRGVAAPQSSRLAYRIASLLEQIIWCAADVQAYGDKWTGGGMKEIADRAREATREYEGIG